MRLCFVGDSITVGTGDSTGAGWVGRLVDGIRQRGVIITSYNLGVRGDTSREIRRRWFTEARGRLPEIEPGGLVFALGLNDCVRVAGRHRRVPLATSIRNVRATLVSASAWRPTIAIGPAPVLDERVFPGLPGQAPARLHNAELAEMNASIAHLAQATGVPFVDLFRVLGDDAAWSQGLTGGDGLHPTAAGYARLAALIERDPGWTWLYSELRSGGRGPAVSEAVISPSGSL